MFDRITAEFLRSAPGLPGLDSEELPKILTARFAQLVGSRLRQAAGDGDIEPAEVERWPLTRIADVYEVIASIVEEPEVRRASAFVAGTAQQILAQQGLGGLDREARPNVDRDRVDPTVAAALLFLAAEQYADAIEAARQIVVYEEHQNYAATLLTESIRDLAAGNISSILARADRRPERFSSSATLEERGTIALIESLLVGVEILAAEVLTESVPAKAAGRFDSARSAFTEVLELSTSRSTAATEFGATLITTYPGPRHLASLLIATYDGTLEAPLTKTPPPPNVDERFWTEWLRHRADGAPFTWHNHRDAISERFHYNATSAVMILPTGAGKTTVSCLKIAGVLAARKSVVFVAPTHALVEQLAGDLQEIFPEELLGSIVSSDFDRLFAEGTSLRRIEVMTPEHCLALLSYAPQAFHNVGLMVFDECHLLSPLSGLRRAIDGMFCVLAFNSAAPDADLLFLSAMIENGADFAQWIRAITGRPCVFVDTLWKPSRQARGVVTYEKNGLRSVRRAASAVQRARDRQRGRPGKNLSSAATNELQVEPFALFGLHHNWLSDTTIAHELVKLSESKVQLTGRLLPYTREVALRPNANEVATRLAELAAHSGLKTIVFVNVKNHAVSVARRLEKSIGELAGDAIEDDQRWRTLEMELGGRVHSVLHGLSVAVPHHGEMIRLERELAERMFRRPDGALVIVATPTLAQGLNLPAHLAILAGDVRVDDGKRKPLAAHEILNAAARAGRAGHLANGMVLLIPEPILSFSGVESLSEEMADKLRSVLPEDDRCLEISDPLQLVLDRVSTIGLQDAHIEYALNRLSTTVAPEGVDVGVSTRFSIQRSFGAYLATRQNQTEEFNQKVTTLNKLLAERNTGAQHDPILLELAAQSGASVSVLSALRSRLRGSAELPKTIVEWASWIVVWLADDPASRRELLDREAEQILRATGRKTTEGLSGTALRDLLPGVQAWLSGEPLRSIETALGGDPDKPAELTCPRARKLVTRLVPFALTFVAGLTARAAAETAEIVSAVAAIRAVLECLPTAIRRGFDSPSKLAFAELYPGPPGRVQIHQAFQDAAGDLPMTDVSVDYARVVVRMRQALRLAGYEPRA